MAWRRRWPTESGLYWCAQWTEDTWRTGVRDPETLKEVLGRDESWRIRLIRVSITPGQPLWASSFVPVMGSGRINPTPEAHRYTRWWTEPVIEPLPPSAKPDAPRLP